MSLYNSVFSYDFQDIVLTIFLFSASFVILMMTILIFLKLIGVLQ